jgi:hypothetical protein
MTAQTAIYGDHLNVGCRGQPKKIRFVSAEASAMMRKTARMEMQARADEGKDTYDW